MSRARRAPQPSEGYDRVKLGQSRVHPYPYPTRSLLISAA